MIRFRFGSAAPVGVVAAVLLTLTSAVVSTSAAYGDELVVRDARRDYWHDHRFEGNPPDQHPPDVGKPDIVRTVYRHMGAKVRVRVELVDIYRASYFELVARFRTDQGVPRRLSVFRATQGPVTVRWSGGRCRIGHSLDYAHDVFIADVPRSCLSLPHRVSFKSATRWWPTSDDVPYFDITGTRGFHFPAWSAPVRRG